MVSWMRHEEVTAAHLRTALSDLRQAMTLTPANSSVLRSECEVLMRSLDSQSWLRDVARSGPHHKVDGLGPAIDAYLFVNAEPDLVKALLSHVYANHHSQCDLPRCERQVAITRRNLFHPTGNELPALMAPRGLAKSVERSHLAMKLYPHWSRSIDRFDREQAIQLALELCICAEIYRRENNDYPRSLAGLEHEFGGRIPNDAFGESRNDNMILVRNEIADPRRPRSMAPQQLCFIVYSRGRNGIDDGGTDLFVDDVGIAIPIEERKP